MRYNSINEALKKRFGCKVFKVTLESGCGCPNRDAGKGGCVFCSLGAYQTAIPKGDVSLKVERYLLIKEMLLQGIEYVKKRHHNTSKFISYFQAGSNTYAEVSYLKKIFLSAIDHPDVVGLFIATRPDCLSDAHIDLMNELSGQTMLCVEMGLQTANDNSLNLLSRGHTVDDFISAAQRLRKKNISICAHVILGVPGESIGDMLKTAQLLNELKIDGVKIHNLHVLKGTVLEKWYKEGKVCIPDLKTYASWTADFIEHLDPSILIHRVNGHAPRNLTVAPEWSVNKLATLNAVEKELNIRNSHQGCHCGR